MTTPERLWDAGNNKAVDAAVVADGHVLLVRRRDGGGWAVPGGFVDPGEDDVAAMLRELSEETGVDLRGVVPFLHDRQPVDDPRNEPDRWITTRLGVFQIPGRVAATASDDATDARWVPLAPSAQMDARLRAETGVGLYQPHPPLVDAVAAQVSA